MQITCSINGKTLTVSRNAWRHTKDGDYLIGYSDTDDLISIKISEQGYSIEVQSEKFSDCK